MKYVTRDGDTVDEIAWKVYGSTSNHEVEVMLTANHGLAAYGPILPAGLTITLPEITASTQSKGLRLWD